MSTASRSASLSLSKDARIIFGSHAGARLRVASITSTTVVVSSADELTGTSLYAGSTPGQLIILSSAAGSSHIGKTADVTGISGTTLTVDVDFTTGPALADGDIIAVVPPLSVELFPNAGHTLNDSLTNDYTMGLTETFDTHNTPMTVDAGGDVSIFQTLTSEGLARLLAFGIGAYKTVRTVADGVTNTDTSLVSATANFASSDVGEAVSGTGIQAGTTIASVTNSTTVVLSLATTATATGVSVTIGVAGTHKYRPVEANDGTFSAMEDGTFWIQDGNGVIRKAFFGGFGTGITLDYPEGGTATATFNVLSNGVTREIGGSGKLFTTGANNYIRANFVCDTGPRITFRSAFVELGGSFGSDLTSAVQTTVKNLSVRIERAAISDRTLGDPYIVKPEEGMFTVVVTGTRILSNDTLYENSAGGSADAEPGSGFKTETRMLIKAISANDTTKTLTIDIPRGVFSSHSVTRVGQARFTEDFEFRGLASLDGSTNCVSTAIPPLQCKLVSSVTKNLLTAL